MKKTIINELLNQFEINFIERHIVYSFLQNKKIDYKKSPIILKYLSDFEANPLLLKLTEALKITKLKLLENYLELLIPKNDRKVNGAFFTPNYIVNFIIKEVSPEENQKCLDPSSGCGAFLIGLVEYFTSKFGKKIKNTIRENIYGSDILEYNVNR